MCFHPTAIQVFHGPEASVVPFSPRTKSELQWHNIHIPLVAITAPPGYGKTTLLQQWQHQCHKQGQSTALLRLHQSANHLPTLLKALGRLLRLTASPNTLAELNEQLAVGPKAVTTPHVIFIDNLEALLQPHSLAAINTLLQLAHQGVRFVLAGRSMGLRLAQWHLNQALITLDKQALAVGFNETPTLSQQCKPAFDHWPLATFFYAQQQHRTQPLALTLKAVHAYFDELLDTLCTPEQQRLLLLSAIAPSFTADSLNYLSGQRHAQANIQRWQQQNLFIETLDNAFTFMPLFRSYLCEKLDNEHPKLAQYAQKRLRRFQQQRCTEQEESSSPFTSQEQRVLAYMTAGKTNKAIAQVMQISEGTVKWHLHNLYRKMQVTSRAQAILKATDTNLAPTTHFKVAL